MLQKKVMPRNGDRACFSAEICMSNPIVQMPMMVAGLLYVQLQEFLLIYFAE
jgi:hypothetical protein